MNRISDERLETMLDIERVSPVQAHSGDWHRDVSTALRELLAYRKAVREYVSALDALRAASVFDDEAVDYARGVFDKAEASLRALAQPEQEKP